MKKRVVITGVGVISPYGIGADVLFDNVVNGVSAIKTLTKVDKEKNVVQIGGEISDIDTSQFVEPKEAKRLDDFILYSLVAASDAMKSSGIKMEDENKERIGVYAGIGVGGLQTFEKNHSMMVDRGDYAKCSPFTIPMLICNMASGRVAMQFGLKGPNKAIVSACASSSHSIGDAFRTIQYGDADVMLAGGSEAAVCNLGIGAFTAARTLSKRNDEPEKASRPFDNERDGFVMSEGSAFVVMESLEHAKNRNACILAEIVGYGQSSDAFDIVAPDPEGLGAELAVKNALDDAGINPSDIDYINAHGTSTVVGDIIESKMLERVFGDKNSNPNLLVSSTKSSTGHFLGAAGAMEAVICVFSMNKAIVPPTINLVNQGENISDLNYVPNKAIKKDLTYVMSNSFGFGGQNAVLIVKKYID